MTFHFLEGGGGAGGLIESALAMSIYHVNNRYDQNGYGDEIQSGLILFRVSNHYMIYSCLLVKFVTFTNLRFESKVCSELHQYSADTIVIGNSRQLLSSDVFLYPQCYLKSGPVRRA